MTEPYNFLIDAAMELKSEVSAIEHQIEMKKIESDSKGIRIDRIWLAKAKYAKQKKNEEAMKLQAKAGRIKREHNILKAQGLAAEFMDVARQQLDEETFELILKLAKHMYYKEDYEASN